MCGDFFSSNSSTTLSEDKNANVIGKGGGRAAKNMANKRILQIVKPERQLKTTKKTLNQTEGNKENIIKEIDRGIFKAVLKKSMNSFPSKENADQIGDNKKLRNLHLKLQERQYMPKKENNIKSDYAQE
jgi:hypothetical protein